jgi:hypothetical protein
MKFNVRSRFPATVNRALVALAALTGLGLEAPSAFASIGLSYSAVDTAAGSPPAVTGSGTGFLSVGPEAVGNFTLQLTANTTDPSGTGFGVGGNDTTHSGNTSTLSTTTFTISNVGSGKDTMDISLTGAGFTVGAGQMDNADFSVSGSSSAYTLGTDTTTDTSTINGSAIPGTLVGTPVSNGLTTTYSWNPGASSGNLVFLNTGTFSIGQTLAVTLGAGDSATLTINTSVVPTATPEPSTMAIAGLSALGMIGYGLRRRKTMGA